MKRTENGKAVLETPNGTEVVALDALAKLSGVSGGAVVKVLAALRILADYELEHGDVGRSQLCTRAQILEELVEFENVPQAMADETRSYATQNYCHWLAKFMTAHPLAKDIRLTRCL